ncbi:MAG: hypothetical protein ACRC11_18145 [Xenococcaceae cyanobacterium]
MNATQERALCWMQGLRQAIAEKNSERKTFSPNQKLTFIETRVSDLERGNVIKLSGQLHLIEAVQSNAGIYTLFVVHRNRRDARSFFASETVMRKA